MRVIIKIRGWLLLKAKLVLRPSPCVPGSPVLCSKKWPKHLQLHPGKG